MLTEDQDLDGILALQFVVAWAGEGLCDPPRLSWWRTDLIDEAGGGDLFRRLLPRTWAWAGLETARTAAILADRKARASMGNPDHARTLFHWGAALDEKLAQRLRHHKLSMVPPAKALPMPLDVTAPFSRPTLEEALRVLRSGPSPPRIEERPSGRHVQGRLPEDPVQAAGHLAAALLPLGNHYPCPYYLHADPA